MIDKDYAEAILLKLVSTWSGPGADMRAILDVATAELSAIGLEPAVNSELVAVYGRHGQGGVLFNGNLDTVPVGQAWTRKPEERDGPLLYGRGTADMKAGCAAMLAAARELKRKDVPFSVLFTTDAETTKRAAMTLQGTGLVKKAAAAEPGGPPPPVGLRGGKGDQGVVALPHGQK